MKTAVNNALADHGLIATDGSDTDARTALKSYFAGLGRPAPKASADVVAALRRKGDPRVRESADDKLLQGAVEALGRRAGMREWRDKPVSADARDLQYRSLLGISEAYRRATGRRAAGDDHDVAAEALRGAGGAVVMSSGKVHNAPADFPNVLSALAGKMMNQAMPTRGRPTGNRRRRSPASRTSSRSRSSPRASSASCPGWRTGTLSRTRPSRRRRASSRATPAATNSA